MNEFLRVYLGKTGAQDRLTVVHALHFPEPPCKPEGHYSSIWGAILLNTSPVRRIRTEHMNTLSAVGINVSLLMHTLLEFPDTNLFAVEFTDSLTETDYEILDSALRSHLAQHTTSRALFVMKDVNAWTPSDKWETLSFDIRHLRDLDKVAIVGDDLWERWLKKAEILFPVSDLQTYAAHDRDRAVEWLRGNMDVPGVGPGSMSDPEAEAQDHA